MNLSPELSFILGFIVGAGVVGSSVQRTISVSKGRLLSTFFSSNLNSLFYFFSITFVAKENFVAYLGTCVGSWAICQYLAFSAKKNLEKYDVK